MPGRGEIIQTRGIVELQRDRPEIVTVVASPPPGTSGPTDNNFIDAVLRTLAERRTCANRVVRVASMRDLDIELGKILTDSFAGTIRLQIIGHSISGALSLGASWIPDGELVARAFKFPHYVLDTNPSALGLIAKYAGKISEVLLVGCHVGSASSFGYAVNGRTLTYTLAELLRCTVRGADDVVSPEEFDADGWYAPGAHHRPAHGWRWIEAMPPVWTEPSPDPADVVRLAAFPVELPFTRRSSVRFVGAVRRRARALRCEAERAVRILARRLDDGLRRDVKRVDAVLRER